MYYFEKIQDHIGKIREKKQKNASIRICASTCYRVFHTKLQHKEYGGCPDCGFAHYGAVWVLGSFWKAVWFLIRDAVYHKKNRYPNQIIESPYSDHPINYGSCGGCGWSGKLKECETGWESEGWEYPSYKVNYCPKCGDELEDYFVKLSFIEKIKYKIKKIK